MRSAISLALTIVLLAGCRRETPETASAARDSSVPPVAPNSASGDTAAGLEAEAPRLIPAMRAQLAQIESGSGGNLESYRGTVGHLIDAMEADLTRSGRVDSGGFKLLADSLLRELGGGAGNPMPDKEAVRRSVPAVRRLLDLYQARMGQPRAAP
jgi:ABC-type transporter Mla MlaB component